MYYWHVQSHSFTQLRLVWHLELHFTLALKHLQQSVWHFLAPLQLYLMNACPSEVDCAITAVCNDIWSSWLTSSSFKSCWRQRSSSWIRSSSSGHSELPSLQQLYTDPVQVSVYNDAKYVPQVIMTTVHKRYRHSDDVTSNTSFEF